MQIAHDPRLICHLCPPDCENLIRKMLVVDPAKRISVAQIKQHRWMLADPTAAHQTLSHSLTEYNSNLGDYSEPVLGIMNTLGIDRQKTIEVTDSDNTQYSLQQVNEVTESLIYCLLSFPSVLAEQQLQSFFCYLLSTAGESERTPYPAAEPPVWNLESETQEHLRLHWPRGEHSSLVRQA